MPVKDARIPAWSTYPIGSLLSPLVATIGGGVAVGEVHYYPITAPVLVLVGCFMMQQARRIEWTDLTEGVPAFLTMVIMPFTFNIAHGIAAGIVSHALVKVGSGRAREVSWLMWLLAVLVVIAYASLPRLRH